MCCPGHTTTSVLRPRNRQEFDTWGQRKIRPDLIRKLVRLGMASGVHDLTYCLAVALFWAADWWLRRRQGKSS